MRPPPPEAAAVFRCPPRRHRGRGASSCSDSSLFTPLLCLAALRSVALVGGSPPGVRAVTLRLTDPVKGARVSSPVAVAVSVDLGDGPVSSEVRASLAPRKTVLPKWSVCYAATRHAALGAGLAERRCSPLSASGIALEPLDLDPSPWAYALSAWLARPDGTPEPEGALVQATTTVTITHRRRLAERGGGGGGGGPRLEHESSAYLTAESATVFRLATAALAGAPPSPAEGPNRHHQQHSEEEKVEGAAADENAESWHGKVQVHIETPAHGSVMSSPVLFNTSIIFTMTDARERTRAVAQHEHYALCYNVDGVATTCLEALGARNSELAPLFLRAGLNHTIEAWIASPQGRSIALTASTFVVSAPFCAGCGGPPRSLVAVVGCEGTGHQLARDMYIDAWERNSTGGGARPWSAATTTATHEFVTASYPHSQPRYARRRPDVRVLRPNKVLLLWREPARAVLSASRRFFRNDDARAAAFFVENADAILFEQLGEFGRRESLGSAPPVLVVSFEGALQDPAATTGAVRAFVFGNDETQPPRDLPHRGAREQSISALDAERHRAVTALLAPHTPRWDAALKAYPAALPTEAHHSDAACPGQARGAATTTAAANPSGRCR